MNSSHASEEPTEKYTSNASSIYVCPLCKMFLQNPAQIPRGHTYCMSCIIWLLRNILDPECLICGKKIVTDDAIFHFGSIKPDETKSKETERIIAKGMNKNFLHSGQSDSYKDDPLLLNQNRWEHSFPKHFVPRSLALGFRHPICDADVRQGATRFVFLAEFQGRCWELVCDDVLLESHHCQDTWRHERTLSIQEFKH
ncbi:uncharacterized protein ACIBXB_002380 [Morphnus guianensis]